MKNDTKILIGMLLINITYFFHRLSTTGEMGRLSAKIFRSILGFFNLSSLPIENIVSYKEKYANVSIDDMISNRTGITASVTWAGYNNTTRLYETPLPDIRSVLFRKVIITGNSDAIVDLKNKCVISEECYDIDKNIFFVDGMIYRVKNNICLLRNSLNQAPKKIPSGIMISGKFASNYFHALNENLNRLTLIQYSNIPSDVPLIVDNVVNRIPSIKQVIEIINSHLKREIIYIHPDKTYIFEKLYYISHINRVAPHLINIEKGSFNFIFDPIRQRDFRDLLLPKKKDSNTPKRFFISREGTKSRKFNEDEIFEVLKSYGFHKVVPEKYSFEEQMSLFNNAEWIVGGTGAAFSNLIFCQNGCKVLCFTSYKTKQEPAIFNTIAYISGCKFWHYQSDMASTGNNIHSNYYISRERFTEIFALLQNE